MLCLPKTSGCQGSAKASEGLVPSVLLQERSWITRGSAKPSKGRLLVRQRGCVRLGRRSSFLFWKLHSISLGKGTVDLHKCLALGLRNYHEDVNSGEEAEGSEDEKTVGPDGRLEQTGVEETFRQHTWCLCESQGFSFYSTPRGENSRQTGPIPNLQKDL